ncbi:hypothetical protein Q8F55_003961 [Vanrija albida]|uniref:ENTH domain-containing protein n=1 Tax=Vanrija albida TaxID=181172 RepID=A0ABR3Q5R0_9TREE
MDDPWATPWGGGGGKPPADPLRGLSMSPPPGELDDDVADPWAPKLPKADPLPTLAALGVAAPAGGAAMGWEDGGGWGAPPTAASHAAEPEPASPPDEPAPPPAPAPAPEPEPEPETETEIPTPPAPEPEPETQLQTALDAVAPAPTPAPAPAPWSADPEADFEATLSRLSTPPPPRLSLGSRGELSPRESLEAALAAAAPRKSLSLSPRVSAEVVRSAAPLRAGSPLATTASAAMARAPSFGADEFGDFGGGFAETSFSADTSDPWGGGGGAWGAAPASSSRRSSAASATPADDSDEYAAWGGVARPKGPEAPTAQETQWESAQRTMALQQARAPFEKVERLKRDWDDVAAAAIGENTVDALTDAEEATLDQGVKAVDDKVSNTLSSLGTLPDGINTYPTVLSAQTSYQKYQQALARPNPNPASSLLHVPVRARRRDESLNSFGPGLDALWSGRSKLGEPDAVVAAAAATDDAGPSKWSFWRKSTAPPKTLTTSGGGILEVKDVSAVASPTVASPTSMTGRPATPGSIPADAASIAPSIGSNRPSTSRAPSISSRPGTPAAPEKTSYDAGGSATDPTPAAAPAPAAPTGVSRFWGRFGRRAASQPVPADDVAEAKEDIELSPHDFAFLSDVPSNAAPGTGDLLVMDGGMPGIESILAPAPPPLPAPLAPPPRSGSGSGAAFAPRMAAPPKPASDFDLLSGLDFDAPAPAPAAAPTSQGWDTLLAPSAPSPSRIASPPIAPSPASRLSTSTPPLAPARAATPPIATIAPAIAPIAPVPQRTASPLSGVPPRTASPSVLSPISPSFGAPLAPSPAPRLASPPTAPRIASPPVPAAFSSSPLTASRPASSRGSLGSLPPTQLPPAQPAQPSLASFATLQALPALKPTPTGDSLRSASPQPAWTASPMAPGLGQTLAPTPAAPAPAFAPPPVTPARPSVSPADDFGDFGDFADFGAPPAAANTSFDDFGDFSAFESSQPPTPLPKSPNPPTPIAKWSNPPTPIAKLSPVAQQPSRFPFPAQSPSPASASASASASLPAPNGTASTMRLVTPPSRRGPSVDHSPALSLLSMASHSPGRWPSPPSPVPPPLAPPPSGTRQNAGASFGLAPPPPPASRPNYDGGNIIDLMDDD